jgi:hypothetical protein
MPLYEYECSCGIRERLVSYVSRDSVNCTACGNSAKRLEVYEFGILNANYVGSKRFEGAAKALGVDRIESAKEIDEICEVQGVVPVEAYYRPPAPPAPKEVTLEELNPYLDGMPLENEPV